MIDLLASLKKLVEWQRVVAAADKVPELERRIAALEARTPVASPFPTCGRCGVGRWQKQGAKPNAMFGDLGGLDVTWACSSCGYTETKVET